MCRVSSLTLFDHRGMQALPESRRQSSRGAWKMYPDLSLLQLSSLQWRLPWPEPNQQLEVKGHSAIPGAQGRPGEVKD